MVEGVEGVTPSVLYCYSTFYLSQMAPRSPVLHTALFVLSPSLPLSLLNPLSLFCSPSVTLLCESPLLHLTVTSSSVFVCPSLFPPLLPFPTFPLSFDTCPFQEAVFSLPLSLPPFPLCSTNTYLIVPLVKYYSSIKYKSLYCSPSYFLFTKCVSLVCSLPVSGVKKPSWTNRVNDLLL